MQATLLVEVSDYIYLPMFFDFDVLMTLLHFMFPKRSCLVM